MDYSDFWNRVEATEEEKRKGNYYLKERGLEEHIKVVDYLESFRHESDERVTYAQVATTLRYDKRIRRCLFKYIGVVEERIRAHMLDSFRGNSSAMKMTTAFSKMFEKYHGDFYQALTHLLFSRLVTLFNKQSDDFKGTVFSTSKTLRTNLAALSTLRNQVCHNKFLLHNLELDKCEYCGSNSPSFYANVRNLYLLLDEGCKNAFLTEINDCSIAKTTQYGNQVPWDLPRDVIVSLSNWQAH